MRLFQVRESGPTAVEPISLDAAGIKRGEELLAFLRDAPEALGERLLIVDERFSHFEESRDRIDILALDPQANLVVILAKTTEGQDDLELRALRYAAMIRTMTYEQVATAYEGYVGRRRLLKEISSRQRISYFLNSDGAVQISTTPRMILVAPGFSKETLATAHWLAESGIGMTCIEVHAYAQEGAPLLSFEPASLGIQVPSFQSGLRTKQQERERTEADRRRRESTLRDLLSHHAIRPGDVLLLNPSLSRPDHGDDSRFRAHFSANLHAEQNVIWEYDKNFYSLSGLCETLRDIHGIAFPHGPLNGYTWWHLEGHPESLGELAESLTKKVTSNGQF